MFRNTMFFDYTNQYFGDSWKAYLGLGVMLTILALTIFIVPEILAFFVATLILWGGMFMLFLAWRLRKYSKNAQQARVHVWRF